MLVEDIFGKPLLLEFDDSMFQQTLNDIILRLRMENVPEVPVQKVIKELNNEFPGLYFSPNDVETQDKIAASLSDNDWAEMDGSIIKIKSADEQQVAKNKNAEQDDQDQAKQKQSAEKMAMKNVRDDSKETGLAL